MLKPLCLYMSFFVALSTIFSYAQEFTPPWCGGDGDLEHPLSWTNLEPDISDQILNAPSWKAYKYILDRFESEMKLIKPSDQEAISEVKRFRDHLVAFISQKKAPPDVSAIKVEDFQAQRIVTEDEWVFGVLSVGTESESIALPCDFPPDEYQELIGYAANAVVRTHNLEMGDPWGLATNVDDSYNQMLANGLAMWPWELWMNQRFIHPFEVVDKARKGWWVFMRPSLGLELQPRKIDDINIDFALAFEPIGKIWYRSDDYKEWWGLSSVITINDSDGIGIGGLCRWNAFSLGFTKHSGESGIFWYLGVDVYKWLRNPGKRQNDSEKFLNNLRRKTQSNKRPRKSGNFFKNLKEKMPSIPFLNSESQSIP